MAFTDYEAEQIREALLQETRRCAVTLGMRKTSVEQLTQAVGIAKGSFYKFYESKEMLFFAVLEGVHSELYAAAEQVLRDNAALSPAPRVAKAILSVCKRLSDTGMMSSSRTMRRRSCAGCRSRSRPNTTTMTKPISVHCWKKAGSSPAAASPWRPPRCAD